MHFRPPAKFVLASLPAGCQLRLEPEPSNPYDEKAIMVFCQAKDIPESQHGALAEALLGTGFDISDVLAGGIDPSGSGAVGAGEIWLGYVADSDGKLCRQRGCAGNAQVREMLDENADPADWTGKLLASLVFASDGAPGVLVRVRESAPAPDTSDAPYGCIHPHESKE
jgi:hypothetical protein